MSLKSTSAKHGFALARSGFEKKEIPTFEQFLATFEEFCEYIMEHKNHVELPFQVESIDFDLSTDAAFRAGFNFAINNTDTASYFLRNNPAGNRDERLLISTDKPYRAFKDLVKAAYDDPRVQEIMSDFEES